MIRRDQHIQEAKRLLEQADESHRQGALTWAQSAATLALAHFAAADHTPPEPRLTPDELNALFVKRVGKERQ